MCTVGVGDLCETIVYVYVVQVQDIRLVFPNGTLMFPPFPADRYRHDVHSAMYQCRIKSSVGLILSREMHVRAGKF